MRVRLFGIGQVHFGRLEFRFTDFECFFQLQEGFQLSNHFQSLIRGAASTKVLQKQIQFVFTFDGPIPLLDILQAPFFRFVRLYLNILDPA
jgi:hypothetical protein